MDNTTKILDYCLVCSMLYVLCSVSNITCTVAPSAIVPSPSGTISRALARAIEVIKPEP